MIAVAVQEYGQSIGVPELGADAASAVFRVEWGDGVAMEIEDVDGQMLVCMSFPAPYPQAAELARALAKLDLRDPENPRPMQVGLTGQAGDTQLVLLMRLAARAARGADIAQAEQRCRGWYGRWLSECGRSGP